MFLMAGYTLREAAEALGVSMITVRRYIKSGKIKARLVPSKFGDSYIIDDLPTLTKSKSLTKKQTPGELTLRQLKCRILSCQPE